MRKRPSMRGKDPRLDRIVQFDERSRDYNIRELVADKPLRKRTWSSQAVLDQGQDGACVGFGWSDELIATPAVNLVDFNFALKNVYWEAQKIDEYPGGEYPGASPSGQQGSSVLAGAKVIQKLGYMKEYRWAFNMQDALKALSNTGPVVVGTNWYEGMFDVTADGFIKVSGDVAGGHCYVLVGNDPAGKFVWIQNSWGDSWGIKGRAKLSYTDLQRLLNEDGEACIPVGRKVLSKQALSTKGDQVSTSPQRTLSAQRKAAIWKAVKEFLRLVVLGIPAFLIQIISGDPSLTLQYGTPILFILRAIDNYIHENPNINHNGLLPF